MSEEKYLKIPFEILKNVDLSDCEKIVLAEIKYLSPCTTSNQHLAETLGMNKQKLIRTIRSLKEKKYIDFVFLSPVKRQLTYIKSDIPIKINTPFKNDTNIKSEPPIKNDPLGVSNLKGEGIKNDPLGVSNLTPPYIDKDLDKSIDKDKDNIGAKSKPKKEFVPPTRTEVFNYVSDKIAEGHSEYKSIDVDKFYNYYSEGNWHMSNGKKVKSWKQCLVTWASRQWSRPANRQETPTDRVSRMLDNILSEEVTE